MGDILIKACLGLNLFDLVVQVHGCEPHVGHNFQRLNFTLKNTSISSSHSISDRGRGGGAAGQDGRDRAAGRRRPHHHRSQQAARADAARGPGSHRGRSIGGELTGMVDM